MLPTIIESGAYKEGHAQGIAVDAQRGYVYYSFTTMLLKTDLSGKLIGTVGGLAGHLGCITLCPEDGSVYGSLEIKHDCIGVHIIERIGRDPTVEDAFYLVRFDTSKIDRPGLDAERDGIMCAMYLRDVVRDYTENDEVSGCAHRYGCSGIDGLGYGPIPGVTDSAKKLMVCYGVYGDTERADNDYQVISQYDPADFARYALPLCQTTPHHSGPERYEERYFFYTGNTFFGVQNLEYDPAVGDWLMAVYIGKKNDFKNAPFFRIDGHMPATLEELRGRKGERGAVLHHCNDRIAPDQNGIVGYDFAYGQTGIAAVGDGSVYFSHDGENRAEKSFFTRVMRYRRGRENEELFVLFSDQERSEST